MTDKTDYFLMNVKQVYPNFLRPSTLELEIWNETLEPYSYEEILHGIKAYRKSEETNFPPNPAKFKNYLYLKNPPKPLLPFSPESYLMKEDIRQNKCHHFYPTYRDAVEYILEEKLKTLYSKQEFNSFSRGRKYRLAVDNGLFADFDKTLDYISERNHQLVLQAEKAHE